MPVNYEGLFELVKTKIFDNIFNYTDITLKNNIKLAILNLGKPVRGILYNNVVTTQVPTTTSAYYLFMCENVHISNLLQNSTDWTDLESILKSEKVNVDIITQNHRLIPKRLIFAKASRCGRTLLAIDSGVYRKFEISADTTYMVINVDSSQPNERTILSYLANTNDSILPITTEFNQHPSHKTLGFVDGYCYRHDKFSLACTQNPSYVELYIDDNVEFAFAISLHDRKTYYSHEEHLYKDVIIIPRELTNGKVYTFDSFNLIVRDVNGKGILVPFTAEMSVSQLTHTVVSVSSFVIDAALDKLGVVADGEIYIQVSNHGQSNQLINNGSITEQLYQQDDAFLSKAIFNELSPSVSGWIGSSLESNAYGKYLADMSEIENYSLASIRKQIECLGIYEFTNTICKHNGEIDNLGESVSSISIDVPPFWTDTDIYPLLYLDGQKIKYNRYNVTLVDDVLNITFTPSIVPLFSNSVIQYELILNKNRNSYKFIPDMYTRVFTLPKIEASFNIFKKENAVIKSIDTEYTVGYKKLNLSDPNFTVYEGEDDTIIIFNESAYGDEYIITFDNVAPFIIDSELSLENGNTIAFIPATLNEDGTQSINVLTEGTYEVYLNEKFLVPNIDYCVKHLVSATNETISLGYQIVIQNLKFLKDSEPNYVEIYKTNQFIQKLDIGYVIDQTIPRTTNNEAYFPGISRLFINGKLVPENKITVYSDHYEVSSDFCNNGDVYCFILGMSTDFHNAYLTHFDNSYFDRRNEICGYFSNGYVRPIPNPLIIPYGHKIYSSYLNEVIKRIKRNDIEVHYINDDNDILAQLSAYDYLKEFDTILRDDSAVSFDYIDTYPGYLADITIDDLDRLLFIKRLVKLILGADVINDATVVYTGR